MIKKCELCGKEFNRSPAAIKRQKHHYCSKECAEKGRTTSSLVICENCGKEFKKEVNQLKKSNHHYCSKECYVCAQHHPVKVYCEICNKQFSKYYSILGNVDHHYCSKKCTGIGKTRIKFEQIKNKTINFLTVIEIEGKYGKDTTIKCICKCGKKCNVRLSLLIKGKIKSCGCNGFKNYREFFNSHTKRNENGCDKWTGSRNKKGYAQIEYKGKKELAHRVSWMINYGNIPPNMCICHHCDNPSCVRIDHIFLSSQAGNVLDMLKKQRQNSILLENDVKEIKLLIKNGKPTRQIAEDYNCSKSAIDHIKYKRTWKHI